MLAYRRDPTTGCLTLFGNYLTGGTGTYNFDDRLGTDDHDQEIIVSPDKRFLYTVNQGSDSIAVFKINSDGSLTAVKGSPFPSGGIGPGSLGLTGNTLYVVNQNADPARRPNNTPAKYTAFRVAGNGRLNPIPNSTFEVDPDDMPTQALISPDGKFLFGIEFFAQPYTSPVSGFPPPFLPARASQLDSFRIRPNGRLERAPGMPQPLPIDASFFPPDPQARYSLGLQVHPTERIVYVGLILTGKLAVYTYDNAGRLTYVTAAPLTGAGVCWILINKDATRAYATNAISNSVSVIDISNPLAPEHIQDVPLKLEADAPTGPFGPVNFASTPFQLALDPTGKTLYVKNHETTPSPGYANGNALHILNVQQDGRLVEQSCSPVFLPIPADAHAAGVIAL